MSGMLRARLKDGVTEVKAIVNHPMETGARKDKASGKKIPRHFIQEISCEHNDKPVLTAETGWGLSKNPYLSFAFKGGAKGDKFAIHWKDNKGETGTLEGKIE